MDQMIASSGSEGGYFAIKGFLYQFDKTLIEVMSNPKIEIAFENLQDIDYENYVLQIKHKETQKYAPHKIRIPVENLIALFSQDCSKKLCLYCHFADKTPHEWQPTLVELDSIIGPSVKNKYHGSLLEQFLGSFLVRFSEDYQTQFKQTISLIRESFVLKDDEEAILYHAIFRSKLLERSIMPLPQRHISFRELMGFLEDTEVTVFQSYYIKYLTAEKYAKLVKRRYFTFSTPNIESFERLFIIECDLTFNRVDLVEIASRIARKYFRKNKSPQPFLAIRNAEETFIKQVKQDLFDKGVPFFDGTYFDGDRLRMEKLIIRGQNNDAFALKIIPINELDNLSRMVNLQEVYQFFINSPAKLTVAGRHIRLQVRKTEDVLRIIS